VTFDEHDLGAELGRGCGRLEAGRAAPDDNDRLVRHEFSQMIRTVGCCAGGAR
jgi:hypothetical protein